MAKSPNFLIIMSDQHAPDVVGAFGHSCVKTPALDHLVASGISFSNAYCAYPMCTPSRASFMTGQLTPAHGVWELGSPLDSSKPTWAHVLRNAGYTVSLSGRMHFVGPDNMHGFDRRAYPDIVDLQSLFAYANWNTTQADDHVMLEAVKSAGVSPGLTNAEQFDIAVTEAAMKELDVLAAQPYPWALTVGLFQPHFPYTVSEKYFQLYQEETIPHPRTPPEGCTFEDRIPAAFHDSRKWLGLTSDGLTPDEVAMARRCYYGMISHVDNLVGKLMRHLELIGQVDNTWIIYLSDHGDNLGEHGFWSKLNFYEESVRVPFIVVPPQNTNPGAKCTAPISLIDWMPTVLELTNQIGELGELPGSSLLPLLQFPEQEWANRAVVADYACGGTRVPMRMVRKGKWKAVFASGFTPVLFNLENDPHEWDNLGEQKSHASIIAEMWAEAIKDGWNGEALYNHVCNYQQQLRYISQAVARRPHKL